VEASARRPERQPAAFVEQLLLRRPLEPLAIGLEEVEEWKVKVWVELM
jgi:hypothetical protein